MIDTHVHFWNYDKVKDAWINDEMKILQRDFLLQHLKSELDQNGMEGIVAVQADQSENETKFLIELAKKNPEIKGIVAWVDLQNENIENKLLYYSQSPIIKGFRHIVQAEPKGFLRNEKFLNGIKLLKNFEFTYDVLIYQHQLKEAIEFVNKFPEQKFIIDHCAKPMIKDKKIDEWKKGIQEISKNENVSCKISGLTTEAAWHTWKEKDFYPYLDCVFECFGTERLLFGSDWPVMLVSGTYTKWKNLLGNYMHNYSHEEKERVFTKNAIEFYNLKE
ncbi:MAG TPA: amidohydrolase family protein [Hanamia sp.]